MRTVLAIALAITLVSAGSASAQVVDMNTVTCSDFNGFKKDTTFAIVMWLDAYYRDEDDPPIIDFDKLGKKAARLAGILAPKTTPTPPPRPLARHSRRLCLD